MKRTTAEITIYISYKCPYCSSEDNDHLSLEEANTTDTFGKEIECSECGREFEINRLC